MISQSVARSRASGASVHSIHRNSFEDAADAAVAEVERLHAGSGSVSLQALWQRFSPDQSIGVLSALVKADLKARFDRGERPTAAEYLEQFEILKSNRARVVSLVYEEFCHREECGERPNPDTFCAQYEPWRDSLLSQLRYHDMFSQVAGPATFRRDLPQPGDRFLTFRLGTLLGQGGSARVFLANDESLGDRQVALKVSTDRGKEPSIQGRLDHDHIVPILSVRDDPDSGLRGMCMPYRPGMSLDEVIRLVNPDSRPKTAEVLRLLVEPSTEEKLVNPPDAIGWRGFPLKGNYVQGVAWLVATVARALAYAHAKGVYHRDVKPANILLTARDGPQLLDFNLSHDPHAVDRANAALRGGTLPYMAPEQLAAFLDPQAWNEVGPYADVFSLGLVLRELLTGHRPESPPPSTPAPRAIQELLDRRALGLGSARDLNPDIPFGLDAILSKSLAYRPEDRYSSASALAEDLERFLSNRPLVEAVNPSKIECLRNWTKRFRIARLLMIAAPLISIIVLLYSFGLHIPDSKDAGKYVDVAIARIDKKQWNLAIEQCDRAIKLDPKLYTAYQARMTAYFQLNQFQQALIDSRKALELAQVYDPPVTDKKMAELYLNLATVQVKNSLNSEAKASYQLALSRYADLYQAHVGLGELADKEMDYPEGILQFGEAIRIVESTHPVTPTERETLGRFYRLRAQVEVHLAQKTHKVGDPEQAELLFKNALIDIEASRKLEVKLSVPDATKLSLAEVFVRLGLGDISASRKQWTDANEQFTKARRLLEEVGPAGGDWVRIYQKLLNERLEITRQKLAN